MDAGYEPAHGWQPPVFPWRSAVTTGLPWIAGPGLPLLLGRRSLPVPKSALQPSSEGPVGGNSSRLLCRVRLGQPLLGHKDGQQNAGSEDAGQEGEDGKECV